MSSLQLFTVFDEDDVEVDDTVEMRFQIESLTIEQQTQTDDNDIDERKIQ